MNGLRAGLEEITAIRAAVEAGGGGTAEILVCPPATLLWEAAQRCEGSAVAVGGQDCHAQPSGAFTGDLSAAMLKDAGATYVILGHSERRALHGETDELISAKATAALAAGLAPIICVGETAEERAKGETLNIVGSQLAGSLPKNAPVEQIVIAYEPVWAIGTGLTPTRGDVAEVHGFIRRELERSMPGRASSVRILYGGSVKPGNATELMAVRDVDGALVGGASLNAADFMGIAVVYR
jgi:triosephosphate isomerase